MVSKKKMKESAYSSKVGDRIVVAGEWPSRG